MARRVLTAVAALGLGLVLAPSGFAWTCPLEGTILRPFNFGDNPYAGGLHRGVDVGSDVGGVVRAPAAGTVSFVGTVPSGGTAVTIQTADGYSVTLLQLESAAVSRGSIVEEGAVVGAVGPSQDAVTTAPHLHLGVRVTAEPEGYVDPLGLIPACGPVAADGQPAEPVPTPIAIEPSADSEPPAAEAAAEAGAEEPVDGRGDASADGRENVAGDVASGDAGATDELSDGSDGYVAVPAAEEPGRASGTAGNEAAAAEPALDGQASVAVDAAEAAEAQPVAADGAAEPATPAREESPTSTESGEAAVQAGQQPAVPAAEADVPQTTEDGTAESTPPADGEAPSTTEIAGKAAVEAADEEAAAPSEVPAPAEPSAAAVAEVRPDTAEPEPAAAASPGGRSAVEGEASSAAAGPQPGDESADGASAVGVERPVESARPQEQPAVETAASAPTAAQSSEPSVDDGAEPGLEASPQIGEAAGTAVVGEAARRRPRIGIEPGVGSPRTRGRRVEPGIPSAPAAPPGRPGRTADRPDWNALMPPSPAEAVRPRLGDARPSSQTARGEAGLQHGTLVVGERRGVPVAPTRSDDASDAFVGDLVLAVAAALGLMLLGAAGAASRRRGRMPEPSDPARIMAGDELAKPDAGADSGCAGMAVRGWPAPHRPRGRVRRPVRHLRAVPPPQRQPRVDGQRDGRARDAGDGRRRQGRRVPA
jgi:hypothetical protein